MSLEDMKRRLDHMGGGNPQNRMIDSKLKSMTAATRYSYQAARFQIWGAGESPEFEGLFNPVTVNEDYDTKAVSTAFDNKVEVGTYLHWKNTDTYWICFTQNKTELAYFRGECRQCNFKIRWVDGEKQLVETLASVIGPSATEIRRSSSMQAKVTADLPNANLKILVQDNPTNRAFFTRYQKFLIQNTTYAVEQVDRISMPGVIQIQALEYYANLIEDDIEENITNAWNIQPIIPEHSTEFAIVGSSSIKPQSEAVFSTSMTGGKWVIIENLNLPRNAKRNPATLMGEIDKQSITVVWDSLKSGMFTLGYLRPDGQSYQKAVLVESLF